jgi:uncharacterized protein (TIGR02594 family)
VVEYLNTAGKFTNDETVWCSAFVNWVMLQAGVTPTRRPNARSWLQWGEPLTRPRMGCVAVFWRIERNDPLGRGHAGFFESTEGNNLWILGGNQTNLPGGAVSISKISKARLPGYRWMHLDVGSDEAG